MVGAVGIDLSTTSTGIVVVDSNQQVIYFNVIKTTTKDGDDYQRCNYIVGEILSIIKRFSKFDFNIEAPAFMAKGSRVYQLFGTHFMVCNLLNKYHPTFKMIPPTQVKKSFTGRGNASKTDMVEACPMEILNMFKGKNYKKTTGLLDLVDAYAIATYNMKG